MRIMSIYLIINLGIIFIPLVLSFEKRMQFYKKFPSVLLSTLLFAPIYITWDSFASQRGDWAFNNTFISGPGLFNLPFEEILFFFTVPFSILFIYETIKYFVLRKRLEIKNLYFVSVIFLFLSAAAIFSEKAYTFTVFLFCAASVIATIVFSPMLLRSNIYWRTIDISYIPFFIVNYILTALPVVTYNPKAILGIKLLTIPVEDFFYSFSMISLLLLFYNLIDTIRTRELRT